MELSKRLLAVARMVTPGGRVADIGTDHGYVPIYLVQHGLAEGALAMDMRPGPLSRAESNIEKYGLEGKITTRLSDGLHAFKTGEADTVIMAGMGGLLMVRIMTEGLESLRTFRECILQPQSEVAAVRAFLHDHHFRIVQEDMVVDGGKYYVMMRAVPLPGGVHDDESQRPWERVENLYGRLLMESGHPILEEYLRNREKKLLRIMENITAGRSENDLSQKNRDSLAQLEDDLGMVREALARMAGAVHR